MSQVSGPRWPSTSTPHGSPSCAGSGTIGAQAMLPELIGGGPSAPHFSPAGQSCAHTSHWAGGSGGKMKAPLGAAVVASQLPPGSPVVASVVTVEASPTLPAEGASVVTVAQVSEVRPVVMIGSRISQPPRARTKARERDEGWNVGMPVESREAWAAA